MKPHTFKTTAHTTTLKMTFKQCKALILKEYIKREQAALDAEYEAGIKRPLYGLTITAVERIITRLEAAKSLDAIANILASYYQFGEGLLLLLNALSRDTDNQ